MPEARFKPLKLSDPRADVIYAGGTSHDLSKERPAYLYKDYLDFFEKKQCKKTNYNLM